MVDCTRALGLGARIRWAGPPMHLRTHVSAGPDRTTVGLRRLVHRATRFELLSHVFSPSGFRLGCSWTRWTPFIVLDLTVGSMWTESQDIKSQQNFAGINSPIGKLHMPALLVKSG